MHVMVSIEVVFEWSLKRGAAVHVYRKLKGEKKIHIAWPNDGILLLLLQSYFMLSRLLIVYISMYMHVCVRVCACVYVRVWFVMRVSY